jgi:hypothetical protein
MAANAWTVHNEFKEMLGNGYINLDTDSFIAILATSASNLNTATTAGYASVTSEVTEANGYLQGTKAVTSPSWTETSGTCDWDVADIVWTASGGSITARFAGIYDDTPTTPTADPIVCSTLLDNTPDDVTATDGNTLTISINASGVFTLS